MNRRIFFTGALWYAAVTFVGDEDAGIVKAIFGCVFLGVAVAMTLFRREE